MKNKIGLIFVILTLCFIFTSCGCDKGKTSIVNNSSQTNNTQSDSSKQTTNDISSPHTSDNVDEIISFYKPPAEVFDIDLSKDDPSNDDIVFSFDNYDKIRSCTFTINGFEYIQIYTYDDSAQTVTINAYSNGIVVDEKELDYNEIADSSYVENLDGYYIKYPALTTATSKQSESKAKKITNDYSSYIGTWTTLPSAGIIVVFNSFEGDTAKFFIMSNTADASHIATTENISAKVTNGNELNFDYHDSWDNYGSGTISLNGNSIYLKLLPSKTIDFYGVYCDDQLLKSSDDVWENTFQ